MLLYQKLDFVANAETHLTACGCTLGCTLVIVRARMCPCTCSSRQRKRPVVATASCYCVTISSPKWRGVLASWSDTFGDASACKSSLTHSGDPASHAKCNGVRWRKIGGMGGRDAATTGQQLWQQTVRNTATPLATHIAAWRKHIRSSCRKIPTRTPLLGRQRD